MKTIFTILISLLFVSAFGQNKPLQTEKQSRFAVRNGLSPAHQGSKADKEQHYKNGMARLAQLKAMQQFRSDESWKLESRIAEEEWKATYFYDATDNNTEIIEYEWIDSGWEIYGRIIFTYNYAGLVTEETGYEWNDSDWKKYRRTIYTYNDAGLETMISYYNWNPVSEQWVNVDKYDFAYAENTITEIYSEVDDDNNWLFRYKWVFEMNESQNITLQNYYFWDVLHVEWTMGGFAEYTYDELNRRILVISYYWDLEWIPSSKEETTYAGNSSESLFYIYAQGAEQWIPQNFREYLLDDYGDIVEFIYSNWDEDEWVFSYKFINVYNYTYSIENLIAPYDYDFKHMVTQYILYDDWTGQGWGIEYSEEYNWFDTSTGLVSVNDPLIRIYPNPATDYININFSSPNNGYIFELYDLGGRLLKSVQLKGDATIPSLGLESGMYLYHILLDEKRLTGKVIVK